MSLRHITIHIILFIFLQNLCLLTFGSSFFSLHKNPSSTSNAGEIPILKDSNGFYVNANLAPSNVSGNNTAKMMLSLVANQTMLASNCWDFSPYDCKTYQCNMYALYSTEQYLWFTADNQLAKAFVSLDDSYWVLNNIARIATSCGGNNQDIGKGRYGTIGMASGWNAGTNFLKSKLFSIWFDPSLDNGVLVFGNDTSKYASSSSAEIINFPATQDWRIDISNGYFTIGEKFFRLQGYLAFDINADVPGFDSNTFNNIINYIQSYFSDNQVKCDSSAYKPVCTYTGSFSFPDFSILPNFNLPGIPILAGGLMYLDNSTSSFTLNIKKINQYLNGENYITPGYDGLIVLDAYTMSRLYLVFNGESQTIHFYHASTPSWDWLYIVIFTIIGLIFIVVLVYFMVKATMESEEEAGKPIYILNADNSMNNQSSSTLHSNKNR